MPVYITKEMKDEIFEALYAYNENNQKSCSPFNHIEIYEQRFTDRDHINQNASGIYNKRNKPLFEFEIRDGNYNGSEIIHIYWIGENTMKLIDQNEALKIGLHKELSESNDPEDKRTLIRQAVMKLLPPDVMKLFKDSADLSGKVINSVLIDQMIAMRTSRIISDAQAISELQKTYGIVLDAQDALDVENMEGNSSHELSMMKIPQPISRSE